jgi:hypothetical protein
MRRGGEGDGEEMSTAKAKMEDDLRSGYLVGATFHPLLSIRSNIPRAMSGSFTGHGKA